MSAIFTIQIFASFPADLPVTKLFKVGVFDDTAAGEVFCLRLIPFFALVPVSRHDSAPLKG